MNAEGGVASENIGIDAKGLSILLGKNTILWQKFAKINVFSFCNAFSCLRVDVASDNLVLLIYFYY